ncbi:MAG TPA: DUF4350 domain-containing protein [Hanamia sp.]|nr:DUF4350 domain-containing protein [Hanamia sp.]
MKIFLRYLLSTLLILSGICSCTQNERSLPSLNESYRRTDKLPFGSFIAYKRFQSEFPNYWINIAEKPFNKTWEDLRNDTTKNYSLYFLITKNLILSIDEVNSMIEYVKAGNDLFISADYIDEKLLDAVYCTIDRKSEIISEVNGKMHDTHVSLFYGNDFKAPQYSYYYFPFLNYFSSYDTGYTRVLGVNEKNLPDYIILFAGKGRLYLHVAPRIFSNYFLLTRDNYHYFEYVTSYLRFQPQYVYWDEYYKDFSSTKNKNNLNNKDNFSSMQVIQENPALRWAFYLALAALLLFVLFNVKRKQREIPVLPVNTNATVAFTETIGRLYLQRKDNRNIAQKIITYFYEYLRKKYFINTSVIHKEFINSLSGKSGVSITETTELFELIQSIEPQENISDEELMNLNSKIENFKNQKKHGRKIV